jgi:hypothetical protein
MSNWFAYKNGQSIGKSGAEGGVILRDEEHHRGARITLKRGDSYISVSCNIYGRIDHTRFFGSLAEAQREYVLMKSSLGHMIENVLSPDAKDIKIWEEISKFVRRFP